MTPKVDQWSPGQMWMGVRGNRELDPDHNEVVVAVFTRECEGSRRGEWYLGRGQTDMLAAFAAGAAVARNWPGSDLTTAVLYVTGGLLHWPEYDVNNPGGEVDLSARNNLPAVAVLAAKLIAEGLVFPGEVFVSPDADGDKADRLAADTMYKTIYDPPTTGEG